VVSPILNWRSNLLQAEWQISRKLTATKSSLKPEAIPDGEHYPGAMPLQNASGGGQL
jgi:hypothetical protein